MTALSDKRIEGETTVRTRLARSIQGAGENVMPDDEILANLSEMKDTRTVQLGGLWKAIVEQVLPPSRR